MATLEPPPLSRRRVLDARDLLQARLLSDVALHPGGSTVAVVESQPDETADRSRSRLVLVDTGTGAETVLTVDADPARPRWSPSGDRLAFIAGTEGARQVWLYEPASGGISCVTSEPHGVGGAACWSPDGCALAYPVLVPADVTGPPGSERAPGRPAYFVDALTAKRDGVVPGTPPTLSRLRILHLADGLVVDLTGCAGRDEQPVWSPDGTRIAFISNRPADGQATAATEALWLVGVRDRRLVRLTDGAGQVAAPVFSPDGTALAYIGNDARADHAANHELRVVTLVDGRTHALTAGLDVTVGVCVQSDDPRGYGDEVLRWPAGDRGILCSFPVGGAVRVAWVPVDRPVLALDDLCTVVSGNRAVVSFDVSADAATVAVVAVDVCGPGEVALVASDGSGERRLTARNAGWLAGVELGEVSRQHVTSADGSQIDAWFVLPPLSLGGGPWPLVLAVHGGPHWPAGWRFSFEYQRLAAQGLAVCVANPRGSQGYGVAFARSNQGAWGGDDFADVLAVADAAAARADVDKGRLAVTGVSYGGYMTCWAIGHTTMFRAAIAENPVIDLVSYFGTTEDGGSMAAAELGGAPWDNPDFYRERSPLTHAAAITTPLLLVHAELDQGCPIGQSEQLFASLRRLGRDVAMLRIPDEGHLVVLAGSVAHRFQRWAAIDAFLARHLDTERRNS